MAKKRIKSAQKEIIAKNSFQLEEALEFFCGSYRKAFQAKFDESIELVFKLAIDPLKSEQNMRGTAIMPNGLGKKIKILTIVESSEVDAAKNSGADFSGSEDMIEKIQDGFLDFDICIATPSMMQKISKVAKILGPKGLMPNPKLGTVTKDIAKAIADSKKGRAEFRSDKGALVHSAVGKISFDAQKIKQNIMALYTELLGAKPEKVKGDLIKKCYMSSSQGPSLALDLKSFIV